jgi:hypothetical protein
MFDPNGIGKITPDEQADALRTLIATFATSVVRAGREPRNAISAEIVDIVDEVPTDQIEVVAQLFSMLALRLRRRGNPRRTAFRLAVETALLAHNYSGGGPVRSESDYLSQGRPDLASIDDACDEMIAAMEDAAPPDNPAWLTARAIAAALIHENRTAGRGENEHETRDLAVAEFLLHAAAQYLAATSRR